MFYRVRIYLKSGESFALLYTKFTIEPNNRGIKWEMLNAKSRMIDIELDQIAAVVQEAAYQRKWWNLWRFWQ